MIVVDTNVLAYFVIAGPLTPSARAVFARDSEWAAPRLWRSELRNILSQYVRQNRQTIEQAGDSFNHVQAMLVGREYDVDTMRVLHLAAESGCTAYDCEFVALAMELDSKLVTADKQLLKSFPRLAVPLDAFTR